MHLLGPWRKCFRAVIDEVPRSMDADSEGSQLHGHGVVVMSLLFQAPPLQRYNRNRFQGGIWKACSVTSSCVRFQFVPTSDPEVLFFFSDPDMLFLPGCPVPSLAL